MLVSVQLKCFILFSLLLSVLAANGHVGCVETLLRFLTKANHIDVVDSQGRCVLCVLLYLYLLLLLHVYLLATLYNYTCKYMCIFLL